MEITVADDQIFELRSVSGDRDRKSYGADGHCFWQFACRPTARRTAFGAALPPATPTPAIDAKNYFDSGQALLGGKEHDKAIGDFNEAIRLDPNFAPAYDNRGIAYAKQGRLNKAN